MIYMCVLVCDYSGPFNTVILLINDVSVWPMIILKVCLKRVNKCFGR